MKKFLSLFFSVVMIFSLAVLGFSEAEAASKYRVAMVTDYGDITDQSFNQTTYEACKGFCEANGIDFTYFKPAGDSTPDRVAMIEKAADEDYNIVVMSGFAFASAIVATQDEYPDITFIALDISEYDMEDNFYNHDKTGARTGLISEKNKPHISPNVYCAVYQEELCGYMAGVAAVKLGYTHLGFLGGMAVPAVIRYGYGFVQGADAAASQLGKDVTLEYVYGNQFFGDADITAYMDNWYKNLGVQVVFACGGGIYSSASEAAVKAGGKVIGVDVDQAGVIDGGYGEGLTVTSAMKGLDPTVKFMLKEVIDGNFSKYGGKVASLGLVSGTDPTLNYVQIPMESTQWSESFSKDDYKTLVKDMFDGKVKVSGNISAMPEHSIKVNEYDNIK